MSRFDWVAGSAQLLQQTGDEFERTRPFDGLRIGTGIHLEPKTAALLLTLRRGGADVVPTGNLNSTQQETVDYLRERGVNVVGGPTADPAEHDRFLHGVLETKPDLILDNGGDLFTRYLEDPWPGLRGGTEETTSGRDRLLPLRGRLDKPLLVINDSPIKQFAENTHAVGAGTVESFIRITNRITNGRRVAVFGYGSVGRGVAAYFRSFNSIVSVVEPQPVLRMRALLDGFEVPDRDDALATVDVVVTVTGAPHVIEAADLARLRDGVVLISAGHLPWELDLPALIADPSVESTDDVTDGITTLRLRDGKSIHVLTRGHMVNLAGPRPLGNSIESMDLGFTLQARCLEAVSRGTVPKTACVVPVPAEIDALVASAYVELARA
ncbi:MAG TPA: adenosylhomocysteinase [Candidatus Limnocylindrales bacterium]|nr:adenosylhomocysteinase [Candidatus Limnocylindrales bacterium]